MLVTFGLPPTLGSGSKPVLAWTRVVASNLPTSDCRGVCPNPRLAGSEVRPEAPGLLGFVLVLVPALVLVSVLGPSCRFRVVVLVVVCCCCCCCSPPPLPNVVAGIVVMMFRCSSAVLYVS